MPSGFERHTAQLEQAAPPSTYLGAVAPVINPIDEMILNRVGGDVRHFTNDVVPIEQPHDARLTRRPKVLPPAAQGVLAASDHPMQVLDEFGIAS